MKYSIIVVVLLVAIAAKAQTGTAVSGPAAALPKPTPFSIVEQGANHQVWERTVYEPGPNGIVVGKKHRVVELATGMNYPKNGQWVKSQEQISVLPQGGAQAVQGQHQVYFPGDIYKGTIQLVTADGKKLKGRPLILSYDDGQNTVLLAVLTNSVGILVGPNMVVYPNAFTGIKADLVYTYRKSGFEQDVILLEQPPKPESLGLKPQAHLQLLTEFTGSPDPAQKAAARDRQDNLQDVTMTFGAMKMVQGKAFSTTAAGDRHKTETPTYKSWVHLQGRTFLIEEVPYQRIAPQLERLPLMSRLESTGTNLLAANSLLGKVSHERLLPPAREAEADTGKILLASADEFQKPGVVLDYEAVVSSTADFTFQSNTTYYVSGGVYLSGLTTIQGGTVIKYDTNYTCGVNILGTVSCTTSPNQPAVLTSADDNTVGEPIATGGPSNGTGSLTLWVTGDSGVNLADLTVWIQDGNGNYIVNGQSLLPSRYWEQWQGYYYEPFIFPAGVGQSYSFGAVCDGAYWESWFSPTLNTGTLMLYSGGGVYGNLSYSETGNPLATQAGAAVGLSLPYGASVNDLVIRNLGTGVQSGYGLCSVTNLQFVHCGLAFDLEPWASLYAGNILMSQVDLGFSGQSFGATVEHLTFDQGACLAEDVNPGYYSFTLNNSLLTSVADFGNVTIYTNEVVILPSGSGVYQTAANGNYLSYLAPNSFDCYLAPGSPYRNTGTTGIDPGLLAQIQKMTSCAPQDGGWPDNDGMPDLGYHHVMIEDSDYDGIPDGWILGYFGNSSYTAATLDATGTNTLLTDYSNYFANGTAPAVFNFTGLEVTNIYVHSSLAPVQLDVTGYPYYVAVAVDDANYKNDATWNVYAGANITVPLGTTEGWHDVWIGLRGHADDPSTAVWQHKRLKLDLTPPLLVVTNPTTSTVSVPIIQLQGFSTEALSGISYDLNNALGLVTNQQALITDQGYTTNTWEFTTNYFQCYDVPLTTGLNIITLHATDLAGNATTTNFSFTVDYTGKPAPVVEVDWPPAGAQVGGDDYTIVGKVDDYTATITATLTDPDGLTYTLNGVVERNGRFWVDHVPWLAAENVVTLTITDAAGNVVTKNITSYQSTVGFTMEWPSAGDGNLWNSTYGFAGGSVDNGYAVWVNGVEMPVIDYDDYGSWGACAVIDPPPIPISPGGVATINVTLYPPGEDPASAGNPGDGSGAGYQNPFDPNAVVYEFNLDKPPRVYVSGDEQSMSKTIHDRTTFWATETTNAAEAYYWEDYLTTDHSDQHWNEAGIDGGSSYDSTTDTWSNQDPYYRVDTEQMSWPADLWPWLKHGTETGTETGQIDPAGVFSSHCEVSDPVEPTFRFYLDGSEGHRHWTGVEHDETFERHMQTRLKLATGGREAPGAQSLIQLNVHAYEVAPTSKRTIPPDWITHDVFGNPVPFRPWTEIPPDQLQVGALGHPDTNGNLYVLLPDGDPVVTVDDLKKLSYYIFNLVATKVTKTISFNVVNNSYIPASFHASDVEKALQGQLLTNVFNNIHAGQYVRIRVRVAPKWNGQLGWTDDNHYFNQVYFGWGNVPYGVGYAENDGLGGIDIDMNKFVNSFPTMQGWVNILAHEGVWGNVAERHDDNGQGDGDIASGHQSFTAPFTATPSSRSIILDACGLY